MQTDFIATAGGRTLETLPIRIAGKVFVGRFRDDLAPLTCARFRTMTPYRQQLIHARWSGEACWIPLGELDLQVPLERPVSSPLPGDILFSPGGASETEILIAYGRVRFAGPDGPLAGSPLLTITDDLDVLAEIGRSILRGGAREIIFGQAG